MDLNRVEVSISQIGRDKINVQGYLMVKNKNFDNTLYWHCENKMTQCCNATAITIFLDNAHYLKKTTDHNHSADAARFYVSNFNYSVKIRAKQTLDNPA